MILLASCASSPRPVASPDVANTVDPLSWSAAENAAAADAGYRIGRADKLKLAVFQVPDLSFDEIHVDAAGNLQLPLIGSVHAEGQTPAELSQQIEGLLAARYLRNPQVTVTVAEAASQKVTVDGSVTKPGVYEMRGRTTLLQAVAMAEGPTRVANLRSVAVFRSVEDRRMVAVFDLASIRAGQSRDPVILGDDIIVVDTSNLQVALREIVAALPGLAVFAYM
ncbi:MAG: polysaccharide biosynthesis/export family protein [Brevundimonas sp.]